MCVGHKPKRCCSPEGRVALPESLWHLLQVLVSVGFKLHIFKRGRVIRISMNTKHNAVDDGWVWLKVQNVGARVGNVGSLCRVWPQKTTNTFSSVTFLMCCGACLVKLSSKETENLNFSLYCSFKWTRSQVRYSQYVCFVTRSQGLQRTSSTMQLSYILLLT